MSQSLVFLFTGIAIGLPAGLSPGPLLTLVITQTLKHNKTEGIKIAIAPVFTDLPIILLTLFILSKLSDFNSVLGVIAMLGGLYLGYLGYESITAKAISLDMQEMKSKSIQKGIIANFLNPSPYIFWFTVGSPLIVKAHAINISAPIYFVVSFYICLVGSKIIIALLIDKSKSFFKSHTYLYTVKILGVLLTVFAVLFIKEALKYFGIL